jgi:heterodisulfide reductase subunit A
MPQKESSLSVTHEALVIGGGIAGLTAALNLAEQGYLTHIIEKESKLGGNLNNLNKIFPKYQEASEFLKPFVNKVNSHSNINVHLNSRIKGVKGFMGNFEIEISNKKIKTKEIKVGTIIVATGINELKPDTSYNYQNDENIITQLELEQKLRGKDRSWLEKIKNLTMILCVNSRQEEGITYCSKICCSNALKNIKIIKELNPNIEIVVIYRDLQMAKKNFEEHYRNIRMDSMFLRYSLDKPPKISKAENSEFNFKISLFEYNLKEKVGFHSDLVVLNTAMVVPKENEELSKLLKVPIDQNGFFLEAHVKLRPIDFATDGIFLCGAAHWPKDIQESIAQANGAAARALKILGAKEIITSGLVASVIEENCIGCGSCVEVCPFNAIEIIEKERAFEDCTISIKKSHINPALCKGCGTCGAQCPNSAIIIKHFSFEQINAMIKSLKIKS